MQYLAKGLQKSFVASLSPEITAAVSIPVIAGIVALGIRRMRKVLAAEGRRWPLAYNCIFRIFQIPASGHHRDRSPFRLRHQSLPLLSRGKVRDIYAVNDEQLLIVTSDRLSAFDVILPNPIPDKGKVLTQVANFWFDKLAHIVPASSPASP